VAESALLQKALGGDTILTVAHPPEEARLQEIFQDEDLISWHFLPMKALQRRIAVLVACDSGARLCNLDSLRILMDFTSVCVENLALKILQELRTAEAPASESPSERAASEPEPAVPPAGTFREPETSPAGVFSRPEPTVDEAKPGIIAAPEEIETGHDRSRFTAEAPPELASVFHSEPVPMQSAEVSAPAADHTVPPASEKKSAVGRIETAPQPAGRFETPGLAEAVNSAIASIPPQVVQPAEVPQGVRPEPAIQRPVAPAIEQPVPVPIIRAPVHPGMSPEEEKMQADAKRFARLLVSEIKLYNEQRLVEARSGGQIYLRLKRDIDRSREMYEKRFPSASSHSADHFHEELVRILAENDPAKLGGEYPGPRVES
jgi:hypothetical protein